MSNPSTETRIFARLHPGDAIVEVARLHRGGNPQQIDDMLLALPANCEVDIQYAAVEPARILARAGRHSRLRCDDIQPVRQNFAELQALAAGVMFV